MMKKQILTYKEVSKSINLRKIILVTNSVIWYNWKFPSIPRIALLKGKLCPLNELDLKFINPPQHVVGKCEMYAKIALLMFSPFWQLNDLKYDGSYWKMFHNELEKHINKEDTVFWKKGFEILQNIQDRSALEKHVKRTRDPISITTKNKKTKQNQ
jgi:hypothetical protein